MFIKYNKYILEKEFVRIQNMGWIKSLRSGPTGVGYTFETLLGLPENSLPLPDFCDIEIKTHRKSSNSLINLFNYNPVGNHSYQLKYIYDRYGYPSRRNSNMKVFNVSLYCNYRKLISNGFSLTLSVCRDEEKLFLEVYDVNGNLYERNTFWDFYVLKDKLYGKLSYLAYVTASNKFIGNQEFFKYEDIYFYKLNDFDTFLCLLEQGKICISFKVGGRVIENFPWQIDSHGTSFCIKCKDLQLLYLPF